VCSVRAWYGGVRNSCLYAGLDIVKVVYDHASSKPATSSIWQTHASQAHSTPKVHVSSKSGWAWRMWLELNFTSLQHLEMAATRTSSADLRCRPHWFNVTIQANYGYGIAETLALEVDSVTRHRDDLLHVGTHLIYHASRSRRPFPSGSLLCMAKSGRGALPARRLS